MKSGSLVEKIILICSSVVSMAVIGLFVYTEFYFVRPPIQEGVEFEELKKDSKSSKINPSFTISKLIINLHSEKKLRYVDLTMDLVLFRPKYLQIMEDNKALINDIIIDQGGGTTAEELNTVTGKIIFENRIKERINANFPQPLVKQIFFSKFIIQ